MAVFKTGALIDTADKWRDIDWRSARQEVRRLQVRIAKAVKEGKRGKVKSLQRILTHSFYAKAMAVKRVTSNDGKKTPGVDGVVWQSARAKVQAVKSLRQHGYRAKPLRRVYIPKRNGKKRPLNIPCMFDRAMQALYALALVPIAETTADRNSYGFREGRSCADAIDAAFKALVQCNGATWILEGDITGCYDNILHSWLLENIPIEGRILKQWLDAGYVENGITYPTRKGTPQGGIISPTLANMTLDGMEQAVRSAVPRRNRVNFIRYADDFIITGKSKTILEDTILPVVKRFLAERGLELSAEKTKVTYIKDGFTFLSQTFRKDGRVLHIRPSKEACCALIRKVGMITRKYVSAPIEVLIKKLNDVLRGWGNYHRHVAAAEAFACVDTHVYKQLWRVIHRRHQNKTKGWLIQKYWTAAGRKWVFAVRSRRKSKPCVYQVVRLCSIERLRHIKVRAEANPYMPEFSKYFWERKHNKKAWPIRESSARKVTRMEMKPNRG